MPVIAAILGAIITGMIYWMLWRGGMEYVSQRIGVCGEEKRREELRRRREAGIIEAKRTALKTLPESRDGAVALMCMIAGMRGQITTEQLELIREEMRVVLEFGPDLTERLVLARHAIEVTPSQTMALLDLRDLLRPHLSRADFAELFAVLHRIAALHGGPTDGQERLLADIERQLPPHR